MAFIKYYFSRYFLLLLAACLLGLYFPQAEVAGTYIILPLLTIALSLTLLRMPRGFFRKPLTLLSPALQGVGLNYLLLGNIIIITSIFLIRQESLWVGMLLIAAVPPAVAVLPLSNWLKSDQRLSVAGMAGAYAGALFIIPLIAIAFFKYIPVNYYDIIILALALVFLPLIISRLAVDNDWDKIVEPYEKIITDICFFIVFYTMIASNNLFLLNRAWELSLIVIIAILTTFVLGYIIRKIGLFFNYPADKINAFVILGTMKNNILAGGVALIIFKSEAALPAIVFVIISCFYSIWLKYQSRHNR